MPTIAPNVFYDGTIALPTEIEGSGEIQVDPITTSFVLTRKYAQLKATYQPPVPGFAPFNDHIYGTAYFVDEKVQKIQGAVVFFNRRFCSIPPPRTETRLVSFTFPGKSSFIGNPALPNGWSPYGAAYPKTRLMQAAVKYTYVLQTTLSVDPNTLFLPVVQISTITYQGKLVDYTGDVYASAGIVSTSGNGKQTLFTYQGTTTPATYGSVIPWIIDVQQRRFMGPVWEQAVVQFTNGLAF